MGWGIADLADRAKQVAHHGAGVAKKAAASVARSAPRVSEDIGEKIARAAAQANPITQLTAPVKLALGNVLGDVATMVGGTSGAQTRFPATEPGLVVPTAFTPSGPLVPMQPGAGGGFLEETIAARDALEPGEAERLRGIRDDYVQEYGKTVTHDPWIGRSHSYEVLGHDDLGRILNDLAARDDLSDTEKTIIYDFLVDDAKSNGTFFGRESTKTPGAYTIDAQGADPAVINDGLNGSETTDKHTAPKLNDSYHIPLATETPEEDVLEEIVEKEHDLLRGVLATFPVGNGLVNEADINASVRSVDILRDLDQTGDFAAFAEDWNRQMLDTGEGGRYLYEGTDPANIPRRVQDGYERVKFDLTYRLTQHLPRPR